jgi:glycosyltransferase involved in cell wall biosynthesis
MPTRLAFITAIPQSVHRGSGCYVGIGTLARGIAALDNEVELIAPSVRFGAQLLDQYLFNQSLRFRRAWNYDMIVGFDLDGFAIAPHPRVPHIANIKGVLADAVPFERGATRAAMALQARWEAEHARRADFIVTISEYCKERIRELYGIRGPIAVVPELIDLERWRDLFQHNPAERKQDEFTVLCVCRFFPRKRVELLLRAAHILRDRIPELRVRIVGGGPREKVLRSLGRDLSLEQIVTWVRDIGLHELAREYNRADVFCLPSVQEGFGIVFLEAMAAGAPIVAARAAAVPEVVHDGVLVEPDNPEALAEGILMLWKHPALRDQIRRRQFNAVERYDMRRIAREFLEQVREPSPV